MTASAPSGTAPPVEIAIASPAWSGRSAGDPAAIRATTGRRAPTPASPARTREAVHRRARERRQVDERAGGLGQDPAGRALDRNALGVEPLCAFEDEPLRLRDRDQLRRRAHARKAIGAPRSGADRRRGRARGAGRPGPPRRPRADTAQTAYQAIEPGRGEQEELRAEREPRAAAPRLTQKPEVGEREENGEEPTAASWGTPKRGEPGGEAVVRPFAHVLRERAESLEPAAAVPPGRNRHDDRCRCCEAEVADATALGARLERSQRQEDERHPLDRDRADPRRARPAAAARRRRARGHRGRAPSSTRRCGLRPRSGRRAGGSSRRTPPRTLFPAQERPPGREDEDGKRAQRLVDPRGGRRRVAHDRRVALGGERENGPVHGCRVTPVGTHTRVGGIVGKGRRLVRIRVGAVHGAEAAVVPVRVGVGREQDGARQAEQAERRPRWRGRARGPELQRGSNRGRRDTRRRPRRGSRERATTSARFPRSWSGREKRVAGPGAGDGRGDERAGRRRLRPRRARR